MLKYFLTLMTFMSFSLEAITVVNNADFVPFQQYLLYGGPYVGNNIPGFQNFYSQNTLPNPLLKGQSLTFQTQEAMVYYQKLLRQFELNEKEARKVHYRIFVRLFLEPSYYISCPLNVYIWSNTKLLDNTKFIITNDITRPFQSLKCTAAN